MLYSFLIPTRRRLQWLKETVDSIYGSAAEPSRVEVVLAIDDDDLDVKAGIETYFAEKEYPAPCICIFPPLGYKNLHIYMNNLAQKAKGDRLILFNDDARMVTVDWDLLLDKEIAKEEGWPLVYQLDNNHFPDIFAVVPRQWVEVLGHISESTAYDSWISDVAKGLGVNRQVSVFARHFAGEKDVVYEYKTAPEQYRIGQNHYYSEESIAARGVDVKKLRCFIYSDADLEEDVGDKA